MTDDITVEIKDGCAIETDLQTGDVVIEAEIQSPVEIIVEIEGTGPPGPPGPPGSGGGTPPEAITNLEIEALFRA